MNIQDLKDKMIAVLGFGQEGKAVLEYLRKHGLKPVIFDEVSWDQTSEETKNYIKSNNINFIFGPDAFYELKGFNVVFRSPGIQISKIKKHLSDFAVLTSQTQWFFENSPAPIVGVTGTKGKGTTSTLIYEMLLKQTGEAYLTGNIGKVQPFEILDDLTKDNWVVYELSSFQLHDLTKSPKIGVVLMVTSEHLDYHATQEEYVEAKSSIAKYQTESDFLIFNQDYPESNKIAQLGKGVKIPVSVKNKIGISFNIPELQLKGEHNLENVYAASAAARAAGCAEETIIGVLKSFTGLEHRLEFVKEKNGIKFYNDSFSTTPETAIAAINSFFEPEILILGGSEKKSDFSQLAKVVAQKSNIKALILVGQEAPRLKNSIMQAGFNKQILERATNMQEIFSQIKSVAVSGDVVLLSPACASFGMFKNYKDRGEQFKTSVLSF